MKNSHCGSSRRRCPGTNFAWFKQPKASWRAVGGHRRGVTDRWRVAIRINHGCASSKRFACYQRRQRLQHHHSSMRTRVLSGVAELVTKERGQTRVLLSRGSARVGLLHTGRTCSSRPPRRSDDAVHRVVAKTEFCVGSRDGSQRAVPLACPWPAQDGSGPQW
jgi:hypothetical protein